MSTPVLSAGQAAAWDTQAREVSNIPSRVLMESAGRATVSVMTKHLAHAIPQGALVVCGPGNNGGDGWVIARALAALGVSVTGVAVPGQVSPDNAANRDLARLHGVRIVGPGDDWGVNGLVVDALLGTGATGAPKGDIATCVDRIKRLSIAIVAVDGPTGLDLSTGVVHAPCTRAGLTVTFGGFRRGHLLQRSLCGRIVVVEMGFPPPDPAWPAMVSDRWLGTLLSPFTDQMHKGERGRVLVVGGAEGMAGAVSFPAKSALRSGAGLVKIAASAASVAACQISNPDIMCVVTELGETLEDDLREAIDWADAIVLGPGLGRGTARGRFARLVLEACHKPLLLDADGLMAFRNSADELKLLLAGKRALLTPHRGEFAALFPDLAEGTRTDPFGSAQAAAERMGQAILLKGVPTVSAAPGLVPLVSATGNPGLATGGTGDVLAGMAATWLARGTPPQAAGAAAAHVHGRAAEDVARHRSVRSLRPDDLLGVLSPLWRELSVRTVEVSAPVLAELEPVVVN